MTSPGTFNKVVLALINYLGNTPTREKVNSFSSSSADFSSILPSIWLQDTKKSTRHNHTAGTS